MRVNEIFYSLQGEGANAGRAAIFIRFAGCNLKCPFCDTQHQQGKEMTAEEIVLAIRKFPCSFIVLTGGEPTLQINQNLIDRLKVLGYEVAIETNGTRPLGVTGIDWVVVSPKADFVENAGLKIEKINEMKVVFNGKHDPQRWLLYSADVYYLQPCDTGDAEKNEKIIQQCIEYIKKHEDWRLSLQTQKILNIR